tara:strand:+ start:210 stop:461 length:252 start_codon:yes stop_codon:yes gene_type:complete
MREVEISVDPVMVLECLDEKDVIDFYGASILFDEFSEKQALDALREAFHLNADKVVEIFADEISVDLIIKLYKTLDEEDKANV